jgi:hypothetical protein
MDSLQDILNRVLQNSAETVAQRVQADRPRRPLREPGALFGDITSAIQNIRSPETAAAMQAQTVPGGAYANQNDEFGLDNPGASSSPAVRKSTIADDFQALNSVTSATQSLASEVTQTMKAVSQIETAAESFESAVSSMTASIAEAAESIASAASPSPVSEMAQGLADQIQPNQSNQPSKKRPFAGMVNWGEIVPRVQGFGIPSSPAEEKPEGRVQRFLNSSSIADGIRGMLGQVLNRGSIGGDGSAGENGARESGTSGSSGFDRLLTQTYRMFRNMDEGPDNSDSMRSKVRRKIGRTGRRLLSRAFRNRIRSGMSGGGGSPPPAGGAGGFFRGIGSFFTGGGAGGGAATGAGGGGGGAIPPAGGGAGAAGAGGAAAGGAGGMGAVIGGVVLGFTAVIAVAALAANALYKLGMQGYETALRVAQFDGQLAGAKAQLDVSRMMRDIQTARTLSESGAGFMKALDKLEAALRPITDGALNVGLLFLTEVVQALTSAFQLLLKATILYVKFLDLALVGQIPNDMIKKLENFANGNNQAPQPILPAAGFHNMFLNVPPAAPPRPPIAPLGGNQP